MGASGLRERKRLLTHRSIAETAWALFAERGYEQVTVADVARVAAVSEATIFNYFRTKEALVFDGMEAFEAALLDAVRRRDPGESAAAAFERFLLGQADNASAADAGDRIAQASRMVAASPALRSRESEIITGHAFLLARLLAENTGADAEDPEPLAAAHSLMGVHRIMLHTVRRRAESGLRGAELTAAVADTVRRAMATLTDGLHDYARRPA